MLFVVKSRVLFNVLNLLLIELVFWRAKLLENELLDAWEDPIIEDLLLLLFCIADANAMPAVLVGVADGNDEIILPTLLLLLLFVLPIGVCFWFRIIGWWPFDEDTCCCCCLADNKLEFLFDSEPIDTLACESSFWRVVIFCLLLLAVVVVLVVVGRGGLGCCLLFRAAEFELIRCCCCCCCWVNEEVICWYKFWFVVDVAAAAIDAALATTAAAAAIAVADGPLPFPTWHDCPFVVVALLFNPLIRVVIKNYLKKKKLRITIWLLH